MTTSVLVTRHAENRYTARALMLPDVIATGATEAEAVDQLRTTLTELQQHSHMIEVDLPIPSTTGTHPWQRFAGMWRTDPDWVTFERALTTGRMTYEQEPLPQ